MDSWRKAMDQQTITPAWKMLICAPLDALQPAIEALPGEDAKLQAAAAALDVITKKSRALANEQNRTYLSLRNAEDGGGLQEMRLSVYPRDLAKSHIESIVKALPPGEASQKVAESFTQLIGDAVFGNTQDYGFSHKIDTFIVAAKALTPAGTDRAVA